LQQETQKSQTNKKALLYSQRLPIHIYISRKSSLLLLFVHQGIIQRVKGSSGGGCIHRKCVRFFEPCLIYAIMLWTDACCKGYYTPEVSFSQSSSFGRKWDEG